MNNQHRRNDAARRTPSGPTPRWRKWASLAGTAAVLVSSAACGARRVPVDLGMPWGATVKDIVSNPSTVEGRRVTVSGEVNRVFGPRWFSIGGEGYDNGEELLVVGPSRVPAILDSLADSSKIMNDLVQVTGYVRVFEEDAIEKQIGADLDGDLFDVYDGKPVLVMDDIDITPHADVIPAVAVAVPVPVAPITSDVVIVDAPDRTSLVGRPVALLGVKVLSVAGPNAFWVGPSPDRQLLVVMDSAMSQVGDTTRGTSMQSPSGPAVTDTSVVRPGQTIAVAGVIRALPENLDMVRDRWSLGRTDLTALAHERIYLEANDVSIPGS